MSYSLYADLSYIGEVGNAGTYFNMVDAVSQYDHPLSQFIGDGVIVLDSDFVRSLDDFELNAGEEVDESIDNLMVLIKKAAKTFPRSEVLIITDGTSDEDPPGDEETELSPNNTNNKSQSANRQPPVIEESDCGANAPGGGGFQPGNTCAAGDNGPDEEDDTETSQARVSFPATTKDLKALYDRMRYNFSTFGREDLSDEEIRRIAMESYEGKTDYFKGQVSLENFVEDLTREWRDRFPNGFPTTRESLFDHYSNEILSAGSLEEAVKFAREKHFDSFGYNEIHFHYGTDSEAWLNDVKEFYTKNNVPKTQRLLFDISPEPKPVGKYGSFLKDSPDYDWSSEGGDDDYQSTNFRTSSGREFTANVVLDYAFNVPYAIRNQVPDSFNSVASFSFSDDNGSYQATGRGEAVEIFKLAAQAMFDAFDEFNPSMMTYTAEGQSRVKLYEALTKRGAKWSEGELIPLRFYDSSHPKGEDAHAGIFALLKKEYADFLSDLEGQNIFEGQHYDRLD